MIAERVEGKPMQQEDSDLAAKEMKVVIGALRSNVVVVVPEPDDRPGQTTLIAAGTEAGRV